MKTVITTEEINILFIILLLLSLLAITVRIITPTNITPIKHCLQFKKLFCIIILKIKRVTTAAKYLIVINCELLPAGR